MLHRAQEIPARCLAVKDERSGRSHAPSYRAAGGYVAANARSGPRSLATLAAPEPTKETGYRSASRPILYEQDTRRRKRKHWERVMSTDEGLVGYVPYLHQYARALTGTQQVGKHAWYHGDRADIGRYPIDRRASPSIATSWPRWTGSRRGE